MSTEYTKRQLKMIDTASKRQPDLKLVLENIHDPHNVSAIMRTCDAVGIPLISLVYTTEKFPKIGKKSSASAFKWVEREKFNSISECYDNLKSSGLTIYASTLEADSVSIFDVDFTVPCAIVMGNEHRGISEDAAVQSHKKVYIPMHGMVQSLNVSVATAIILYEAARQRQHKEMYINSPTDKTRPIVEKYLKKINFFQP